MRILSFIISPMVFFFISFFSETSPHGKDLKISCSTCHSPSGWTLDKKIYSFDHSSTKMVLVGQHKETDCKLCHTSLVFSETRTKTECVNCHADIHSQTTGNYCNRCHSPNSWIVNNITSIHQQSRFPLLGVHTITECQKCHQSESLHRYNVSGTECMDCHRENYMSTTKPNHITSSFSTECTQCHYVYASSWAGASFNHSFFPLTSGHANLQCSTCHKNNGYGNTSPECVSCHLSDYNRASNPVHTSKCYPKTCASCHSTKIGWSPVNFNHDQYFPINSGDHNGIACNRCHTDPNNCNSFSCINCHGSPSRMTSEHDEVRSFSYNSNACYNCHPKGK